MIVTLTNYRPPAREDGKHWTQARLEGASAQAGPFAAINTFTLSPVDSDPTRPIARGFTSELALASQTWFRIVWIDADGDEVPTAPVTRPANTYTTVEELKESLDLADETFADPDIALAVAAASRTVDQVTRRRFWLDAADVTRYYSPREADLVVIDDLVTLTGVAVDDGTGTFPTALVQNVDFVLEPLNAAANGEPYTQLVALGATLGGPTPWGITASGLFPRADRSVRVIGKFGWPAVPEGVSLATRLLASRLLKRAREAPFGVVGLGLDGSAVRIARIDPDISLLLDRYRRGSNASIQLR